MVIYMYIQKYGGILLYKYKYIYIEKKGKRNDNILWEINIYIYVRIYICIST